MTTNLRYEKFCELADATVYEEPWYYVGFEESMGNVSGWVGEALTCPALSDVQHFFRRALITLY